MSTKAIVPQSKMGLQRATSIVPYLTPAEVFMMADAAAENRNGQRDKLMILLLFETGLRVSEAVSLTPRQIGQSEGKPVIYLKKGKGRKPRLVACPEDLAHRIRSYAYSAEIGIDDRIFPINRKRAWQIVKEAEEGDGKEKCENARRILSCSCHSLPPLSRTVQKPAWSLCFSHFDSFTGFCTAK